MARLVFLLGFVSVVAAVDCSAFSPERIKLVTFDVFSALMDEYKSLEVNVKQISDKHGGLLSDSDAKSFSQGMVQKYFSFMNHRFTKAECGSLQPFDYHAQKSVQELASQYNVQDKIPSGGTVEKELMDSWGKMLPWEDYGVVETINALAAAGYMVAPLSNGAAHILQAAWDNAFDVKNSHVFSSDFPVGVFKPLADIYAQVSSTTGLAVDEVLHVAGASMDSSGARKAGMLSALSRGQPGFFDTKPCFTFSPMTKLLEHFNLETAANSTVAV